MSISAVPSLIMLTNKCYFLSKKKKRNVGQTFISSRELRVG